MNLDKIVIFDWGGVIESHELSDANNLFSKVKTMMKSFHTCIKDADIIQRYRECATVNNKSIFASNSKWFENVKEKLQISCSFEEFSKAYKKYLGDLYYYSEVVDYAHSLKDKCKIGIFSNLMPLDKERLNSQVDLSKFDYMFLSFEKNCRKPDVKAYEIVEKDLNIPPKNILFIDDLEENTKVAKLRGWNTCNAFGYELDKIKKSVEAFLD